MLTYTRGEARPWAWENLQGVVNVLIPSFATDLASVNEAATRFDVRRELELGFRGALVVAETAATANEYVQVVRWSADEADGRLVLFFHASFNTLEENIEVARRSADAGAEAVLLSYPPTFYPATEQDIYEYTKAFCDAVDLAVMLFPVPLWGFERIHPASLPIGLLERLVDDLPTVVAIKGEGGHPSLAGFTEPWNRLGDRVIVTMPLEAQAIPLATILPTQLIATSNTECMGGAVPTMFALARDGKHDDAMELFWRMDPVRRANDSIQAIGGANTVHRMAWKYQAWLTGFNGGPLRMPTSRLVQPQMNALRRGAAAAGVIVDERPDAEFFVGRNPV